MTKASRPRGATDWMMFEEIMSGTGPQRGQNITINGDNDFKIKQAKLILQDGHYYYKIVAAGLDGTHYSTALPSEVLQYTGWGWNDSPIPFELNMDRDDFDWHVVDNETQRELDVRASDEASAVAKAVFNNSGFGDSVFVHPVFQMSIKPSGTRWLASLRRLLNNISDAKNPLNDCFTHPSAQTCALGPLTRLTKRNVIHFGQDLDELFEKHIPGGIKWPALGQGVLMCTHCFKSVSRSEPHSLGTECNCDE